MDMRPPDLLVKPAPGQRERLPDRRVGEIFLNSEHGNSLLDTLAHDAAIFASLALQFGCPLETLRHAVKRDSAGNAASPIGEALDRIEP